MNPDRLRLELRAISVSLAAGLRSVDAAAADGARLRALALFDRLEAKIQEAREDPEQSLSELDVIAADLAAARLAIERAEATGGSAPAPAPIEPD